MSAGLLGAFLAAPTGATAATARLAGEVAASPSDPADVAKPASEPSQEASPKESAPSVAASAKPEEQPSPTETASKPSATAKPTEEASPGDGPKAEPASPAPAETSTEAAASPTATKAPRLGAPAPLALVPGANTVKMAWVGTPADRPVDPASLLTLQAALNAAGDGDTVSFDPNDYVFTTRLIVQHQVSLDTAGASTLFAQFLVSNGGLAATSRVSFGVISTVAVVTVTANNAVLSGINVVNPNGVLRPTGIQLGAGVTGVVIDSPTLNGGGQVSSYGVNLTTGSATITNSNISGFATCVIATAASTASNIVIDSGSCSAAISGISLGTTSQPVVRNLTVTADGTGTGSPTGIDLANSSAAIVTDVTVTGFTRGIGTATTASGAGPVITSPTIVGALREGIALGATTGAVVTGANITGTGAAASSGIVVLNATDVVITQPTIQSFQSGISTALTNTGTGPTIDRPVISDVSLNGISLGSTQRARIITPVITGTGRGTGINLNDAGRVQVTDATIEGFGYGIGAVSATSPLSDRTDIVLTNIKVTGGDLATYGIYLLGTVNARITNLEADINGGGIVLHEATNTRAEQVHITGHDVATPTSGAAIVRMHDSTGLVLDDSSIDDGSYGYFFSQADDITITNGEVRGVSEYGVYGRSVSNLSVSGTRFLDNGAVGNLVVTSTTTGISHDISLTNNVMQNNRGGVNLYVGTSEVNFERNVVSGQPYVLLASPAHDVTIADNDISQVGADGVAAIMVTPRYAEYQDPDSHASSDIMVRNNTFIGGGTFIQVGSPAGEEGAEYSSVSNPVQVRGNKFPASSTAIRTLPNAVFGVYVPDPGTLPVDNGGWPAAGPRPVTSPVAVDARDYDQPNDWGATCRGTGYLDENQIYAGGGAAVYELSNAPALYPTNCIELSLTEAMAGDPATVYRVGDVVTWTLTPHNSGLQYAPSGWSIHQLLPSGVELVSITGSGYTVSGLTATANAPLAVGADAPALTVKVRVTSAAQVSMRNVAYVAPLSTGDARDEDRDGFVDVIFEQLSPLVVPTIDTDTDTSPTDNDAQGRWTVTTSGGGGTSGGGPGGGDGGGLALTGATVLPAALLAALLLALGAGALASSRRRHRG